MSRRDDEKQWLAIIAHCEATGAPDYAAFIVSKRARPPRADHDQDLPKETTHNVRMARLLLDMRKYCSDHGGDEGATVAHFEAKRLGLSCERLENLLLSPSTDIRRIVRKIAES